MGRSATAHLYYGFPLGDSLEDLLPETFEGDAAEHVEALAKKHGLELCYAGYDGDHYYVCSEETRVDWGDNELVRTHDVLARHKEALDEFAAELGWGFPDVGWWLTASYG